MARRCAGYVAEYRPDAEPECTWVDLQGFGTISSTGYGSCVGMVLHNKTQRAGVVAHFSGSMNDLEVRRDVEEILALKLSLWPKGWQAWIFGGESLRSGSLVNTTTVNRTKAIIDRVRRALTLNGGFEVDPRVEHRHPEQKLSQGPAYKGHSAVELDVATGRIAWPSNEHVKRLPIGSHEI